jgi:hypothetical protein
MAFNPTEGMEHGAVLASNSKLVRGLPTEQDRRWLVLAVVRIDLI